MTPPFIELRCIREEVVCALPSPAETKDEEASSTQPIPRRLWGVRLKQVQNLQCGQASARALSPLTLVQQIKPEKKTNVPNAKRTAGASRQLTCGTRCCRQSSRKQGGGGGEPEPKGEGAEPEGAKMATDETQEKSQTNQTRGHQRHQTQERPSGVQCHQASFTHAVAADGTQCLRERQVAFNVSKPSTPRANAAPPRPSVVEQAPGRSTAFIFKQGHWAELALRGGANLRPLWSEGHPFKGKGH